MAQPSSGADAAGELEEALDEATYWAGKLFDQCRAAAAALAWLPQSLAADPVPTLRELARAASDGEAQAIARERIAELERLAHVAGQCAQMHVDFLHDPGRHLPTIGYNVYQQPTAPGERTVVVLGKSVPVRVDLG